jgi:hypothetical protein
VKTQIVQIEAHDDYISVRDRMGWGQTARVLLVWPPQGSILNRRLDLTLLKRHSAALGSQLALVTQDREVRYQADKLNIPVYRSIREAEESRWRRPHKWRKNSRSNALPIPKNNTREKPDLAALREQAHPPTSRWLRHPTVRISFFTLGVLSMLVIAALFIPSAEIYVTPATITESVNIDVNASPEHNAVEISGAVPTYWDSIVVEGRGSTPSTGETTIPRQAARGRATFINLTDEAIHVPIGTIVSTQDITPIRFATTQEVTIPIGPEGAGVFIEAIQPGNSGNISAEEIIAIEGSLGLNLTVINKNKTTGGTDFTSTAPTEADFQRVYEQLYSSLEDTAFKEFKLFAMPGDVYLTTTPSFQQAFEENYTPEVGQPSDKLDLTLRLGFEIPFADGADLYQLGRAVLDRHLSEGYTPQPETLQITHLTDPIYQELGEATWKMQASWQIGANLDSTQAVSLVLGSKPEHAIEQLKDQMPLEDTIEIKLVPSWWPTLPILPFRVSIINQLDQVPPDSASIR